MTPAQVTSSNDYVKVINPEGQSSVVVVCEHASSYIPPIYRDLGLTGDALQSHAAWDPGALAVAQSLSSLLDAPLVASGVSRLVYDCNRPPSAPDAMPHQSETIKIPGNAKLTTAERQARTNTYYEPFRANLAQMLSIKQTPVIVTIHSFTPIYHGQTRAVEIGVLHDSDARLADAMLSSMTDHTNLLVQRNEPYGPEHGVTHTLIEHALTPGHLNVMLEIRNDLIRTTDQQDEMSKTLATWLSDALARLHITQVVQCQA